MAIKPLDFTHLHGTLRGISDRALTAHLALYRQAVERLAAIEAAYPVVEWRAAGAPAGDATTETLLKTPVSRLDLRPVGNLAEALQTVEGELEARGILFRPAWYLGTGGDDFWTADRAISINIPWCYANPTLWRLANRSEVSAYTPDELVRTLRHEAAHALCYAFELWREQGWQEVFGDSRAPYLEEFTPTEGSRDFVEYLVGVRAHYAQKHADEDFAETFACWLDPTSNWRQQYAEWPVALRKLEYVDACWAARKFWGTAPNTYLGRREPYQVETRTVAAALGIGTTDPPMTSPTGWSAHAELLRQEPEAYNKVILHEALFGQLGRFGGPLPDAPPGPRLLAEAERNWGSWESYLLDLRLCCAASEEGWALTLWDDRRWRMRNAMVSGNGAVPAGCRVLLAIDTFAHSYALDYGIAKHLGIAAQFENIEWAMVGARLDVASPPPVTIVQTFGEDQHEPQEVQPLPLRP
jgi:superoxide dismutase